MSTNIGPSKMRSTALTVYNLPSTISEQEVRSIFPSARYVRMNRHPSDRTGSQGMCTVHFDNPNECQKVYAECQTGKTAGGLRLHVEFSSSWTAGEGDVGTTTQDQRRVAQHAYEESYTYSDNSEYYSGTHSKEIQDPNVPYRARGSFDETERPSERYGAGSQRYDRARQDATRSSFQRPHARSDADGTGCTLTVSNLPYSATESDIKREFVDAFKVILNLNDQGQSRGVAQVTFSTPEQCNAALYACNQKTMGGRALRGRINRDHENGQSGYHSRDGSTHRDPSGNRREMGGNQRGFVDSHRDFGNNRNEYGGMQRGGYGNNRGFGGNRDHNPRGGSNQYRDFNSRRGRSGDNSGGRMNDYNSGRFDRDNRYASGGPQGNRFAQRDERRDRSPNRNEPIRGYGGGKGPRITSAVIRGNQDRSSSSESSSDDAN